MDCEFGDLAAPGRLSMPFDLERLINDFILVCALVGNDFLPHLPALDIYDGALDLLLAMYKEQLPVSHRVWGSGDCWRLEARNTTGRGAFNNIETC